MRQMRAACRNESTVEQGTVRRSVNSLLRYIQKRILPTVPDMDHLCGSACATKDIIRGYMARNKSERKILEIFVGAESSQGPLNQRSDLF